MEEAKLGETQRLPTKNIQKPYPTTKLWTVLEPAPRTFELSTKIFGNTQIPNIWTCRMPESSGILHVLVPTKTLISHNLRTSWNLSELQVSCKFHFRNAANHDPTLQWTHRANLRFLWPLIRLGPKHVSQQRQQHQLATLIVCQFVSKLVKFVLSDLWGCLHFSIYQFSRICLLVILVSMKLQVWMIAPFFLERPAEALSKGAVYCCRLIHAKSKNFPSEKVLKRV